MDYEPYYHVDRKRHAPFYYIYDPVTLQWENPDAIYEDIIPLRRKYATNFWTKGTIKISSPASWVDYALDNATGRGSCFSIKVTFCIETV